MLMNNLRCDFLSSTLVFTSENLTQISGGEKKTMIETTDADVAEEVEEDKESARSEKQSPQEDSSPNIQSEVVDISDILLKSGISLIDLQSLPISPALDDYRGIHASYTKIMSWIQTRF